MSLPHGKPYYNGKVPDLAEAQLWALMDDAVRNRDIERTNELIHKIAEYVGFCVHDSVIQYD